MRFNPKSSEGFSLVELMIVVAILAILAVVTAPAFERFIPKYRVEGAAKVLATEIQLVRMRAISKNLRHKLTFDDGAQTVTVAIQSTNASGDVTDPTAFDAPYHTISLGTNGTDHPNVSLGRNTTTNTSSDPNIAAKAELAGSSSYTFADADGNPAITFLPNGRTDQSGFFFLIPTADKGTSENERIRAVEIVSAGMVQQYRHSAGEWKGY